MEKAYVYDVTIRVCVEVTAPPSHKDIKPILLENALDRFNNSLDDDDYAREDDNVTFELIDTHSLE